MISKYWAILLIISAIVTALIGFGNKLIVYAEVPKKVQDLKEQVTSYIAESREQAVRQDTLIAQQGRIINLMLTRKIDHDISAEIGN